MRQFAQALIFGVLLAGVYSLAASGLTLIFGVMKVINVAHGALLILSAYITFALWSLTGIDPLLIAFLTTPVMFAVGWLLYRLAIHRIRAGSPSMSVLLTFAIAIVIEGSLGVAWTGVFRSVTPSYFASSFRLAGLAFPKAAVYGSAVAVLVLIALYLFLDHTWSGKAIKAASQNPAGAQLVGIGIRPIAALTFAVGVATTGVAGSVVSVLYPFFPASHFQWIARLLAIIVLGGMGSLPGTIVGAIALGIAETFTATYISTRWATAVPYAVIFIVLLVRPQGILGKRGRADVVAA